MFERVLPGKTKEILALLAQQKVLPPRTYLAGGTACALQLGHRISYDLDYFTTEKFNAQLVLEKLKNIKRGFKLERTAEQTILGVFPEIKFSLFYLPYKLIGSPIIYEGNKLASLKDITAMKINAIADRGTKRDFIDLYFIMKKQNYPLDLVLEFYDERCQTLAANQSHILKSLVYFKDAEEDKAEPEMLIFWNWEKIRDFFIAEVKKYEKKKIGG